MQVAAHARLLAEHAVGLAALDRQDRVVDARIAAHHLERQLLVAGQHLGHDRVRRGAAAAGDDDRPLGVAQIIEAADVRLPAHPEHEIAAGGAADPGEFPQVVAGVGRADDRGERKSGAARHAERQPVRLGDAVEMIAQDDAAGALHVHRQEARLARNELAEEARDQPHLAVDAAARRLAGEQRHGLAAIEVLRARRAAMERREGEKNNSRERQAWAWSAWNDRIRICHCGGLVAASPIGTRSRAISCIHARGSSSPRPDEAGRPARSRPWWDRRRTAGSPI